MFAFLVILVSLTGNHVDNIFVTFCRKVFVKTITFTGVKNCDDEDKVFLHCVVVSKISQCEEAPRKLCSYIFLIANLTVTDWLLTLHLQIMPLKKSVGSIFNFTATAVL